MVLVQIQMHDIVVLIIEVGYQDHFHHSWSEYALMALLKKISAIDSILTSTPLSQDSPVYSYNLSFRRFPGPSRPFIDASK